LGKEIEELKGQFERATQEGHANLEVIACLKQALADSKEALKQA